MTGPGHTLFAVEKPSTSHFASTPGVASETRESIYPWPAPDGSFMALIDYIWTI